MTTSKILCVALSLASLVAVACGGQPDQEEVAETAAPGEQMSSQGLSLHVQTADRVEGSFSRYGQTISFALSTTDRGHFARIVDAEGSPLVETTLENGVEDSYLLDGTARLRGQVDAPEPTLEGDATVYEQLSARADTKLIAELKEALLVAKVDPAFFSANIPTRAPSAAPGLAPTQYVDVWGKWHLSCLEYHDFPTWTFWGVTTIELRPEQSNASATVRVLTPWYNPTEYTNVFSGTILLRRQYAGYQVRVSNIAAALNGCNMPLLVKVY